MPYQKLSPVHPHVCGEYPLQGLLGDTVTGSPPRVWGILVSCFLLCSQIRFTPTCVGNTSRTAILRQILAVHPHVCGEYSTGNPPHLDSIGSPPRVWGIPYSRTRSGLLPRFTPTCVGNTKLPLFSFSAFSVHPHVCGEYEVTRKEILVIHGSPPRVWGILKQLRNIPSDRRFTPTCVGNTLPNPSALKLLPVHPHVCGEYLALGFVLMLIAGSPPRVWGILKQIDLLIPSTRFTPTCVGNTAIQAASIWWSAVHPHVCGEYK